MFYLRRFNESANYNSVKLICDKYRISNWSLNSDGSIDVQGDVNLSGMKYYSVWPHSESQYGKIRAAVGDWNLTSLPIRFRNVTGNFNITYNSISSLEGGPQTVGGNYLIYHNNLTSLEGCPREVNRFVAYNNSLTSLIGAPRVVRGDFNYNNNFITSLDGGPEYVGGYFELNGNPCKSIESFPAGFNGNIWLRSKPLCSADEKYYKDNSFILKDGYYYPPIAEILFIFLGKNCLQNPSQMQHRGKSVEWGDMIYQPIGGTLIDIINEWDMIQGDKIIWRRLIEAHDSFCAALNKIPNTQFDATPYNCKELIDPAILAAQLEKNGNYRLIYK